MTLLRLCENSRDCCREIKNENENDKRVSSAAVAFKFDAHIECIHSLVDITVSLSESG